MMRATYRVDMGNSENRVRAVSGLLDAFIAEAPRAFETDTTIPVSIVCEGEARFTEGTLLEHVIFGMLYFERQVDCFNVFSSDKDVRAVETHRSILRCLITMPAMEGSEAEAEPVVATLAVSVAVQAEIEVTVLTPTAIVV